MGIRKKEMTTATHGTAMEALLMLDRRSGPKGNRSGFITHSDAMVYFDAALPGLWGIFFGA